MTTYCLRDTLELFLDPRGPPVGAPICQKLVKCLNMSKNQKVEEYMPVPTAKIMWFFFSMFLSIHKNH